MQKELRKMQKLEMSSSSLLKKNQTTGELLLKQQNKLLFKKSEKQKKFLSLMNMEKKKEPLLPVLYKDLREEIFLSIWDAQQQYFLLKNRFPEKNINQEKEFEVIFIE